MTMQTTRGAKAMPAIPGRGIDATPARRPGIPMENDPPRPAGAAHWRQPESQRDPGNVLKRRDLDVLTPVFGTSVPPRGLSGLMRRGAYRIPEHYVSHWLVLLLADRVDAIEHQPLRLAPLALVAGGALLLASRRRRARR